MSNKDEKLVELVSRRPDMALAATEINRQTIRDQQLHISTLARKVDRLEKENAALKANRENVLPRLAELYVFGDRIRVQTKVATFHCKCGLRAVEFLRSSVVTCVRCGEIPRDQISGVTMVESSFADCDLDPRDMATLLAQYAVGELNYELQPLEGKDDELAPRRASGLESKRSTPNWTESR